VHSATDELGAMDDLPRARNQSMGCFFREERHEGDADADSVFVVLYVLAWLNQQPSLIGQEEDHRIQQVGECELVYDDFGRVASVSDHRGPLKISYRVQDGRSKSVRTVTCERFTCSVDVSGKIEKFGLHRVEHEEETGHVVFFRDRIQYAAKHHSGAHDISMHPDHFSHRRVAQAFGKELSYDDRGCLIGIGNSAVYYQGSRSSNDGLSDQRPGRPRCVAQPNCALQ